MNKDHSQNNAAKASKNRELTLDIEKLEDRVAPAYFSLSLSSEYSLLANKSGPLLTQDASYSYFLQ